MVANPGESERDAITSGNDEEKMPSWFALGPGARLLLYSLPPHSAGPRAEDKLSPGQWTEDDALPALTIYDSSDTFLSGPWDLETSFTVPRKEESAECTVINEQLGPDWGLFKTL